MSLADNLSGVKVEIGFGVNAVGGDFFVLDDPVKGELDNTTFLLAPDTVFVDVTEHVAEISTDRGRERELDEYKAGVAHVVFNDDDRTFDPSHAGSPYFGEIVPMKRISIWWETHELFTGWVDDWSVTYERGDNLSRVTADCVDGFAILANQELTEIASSFAGDLSGQRIRRILDRSEVEYPASRSIQDGTSTLGATTLGGNALAYIQACARAEAGYLFVANDGTLIFRSRLETLNTPAGVVFSDDRDAGIPYRNVTQRSTADLLYTRVTGESETTGNEQVAADMAAKDDYFVRTLTLGRLFNSTDAEVLNLATYYLERFSAPEVRFHVATVNLGACTHGQVNDVVTLDLTDVVSVERSPLNVGSPIERVSLIDGVAHHISHGSWTVGLTFSNADTRSFLTLDDAVFGELDANRLAF